MNLYRHWAVSYRVITPPHFLTLFFYIPRVTLILLTTICSFPGLVSLLTYLEHTAIVKGIASQWLVTLIRIKKKKTFPWALCKAATASSTSCLPSVTIMAQVESTFTQSKRSIIINVSPILQNADDHFLFEICTHQLAHCIKCIRIYWHPLSVCLHLGAPFESDLWNFVFFFTMCYVTQRHFIPSCPWEHFIQFLLTHVHTRMHVLMQSPFIFQTASVFYEYTWHLIRWLTDVQLAQPLCSGCLYNCLCNGKKKGEK